MIIIVADFLLFVNLLNYCADHPAYLFDAAINLDPTNRTYLWQRASVYCEMNENKKAIESFELLLKVHLE